MKTRTSLIAAAVAGVCAGPAIAQDAEMPEVYGRINVGVQSVNDDGVATYGQDEGLGLKDVASRVGVRADHELGNGLTGMARYEFGVDATEADLADNNRLSWIGLEGDFGRFKVGKMWSAWYTHLGWNTDRSQFWGGTGYYGYGGTDFNGGMTTTRAGDTVQYTYGGGGYSSNPFTFTVEAMMDGDGGLTPGEDPAADGDDADPQDLDVITAAAMGTFGSIQVNGAVRQMNSSDETEDAEPSQMGVGVRWESGPLYIGGSYIQTDRDTDDNDSPSMVEVLAAYDFDDGLSAQLSVSQLDNDMDDAGDTTGVYAQLNQSLSEQMSVYVEGQSLSVDGGDDDDTSPRVVLGGIRYDF